MHIMFNNIFSYNKLISFLLSKPKLIVCNGLKKENIKYIYGIKRRLMTNPVKNNYNFLSCQNLKQKHKVSIKTILSYVITSYHIWYHN